MKCPHCDSNETGVVKTKQQQHESMPDPFMQRRRVCYQCEKSFYTYEVYSHDWRRLLQIMESADLFEEMSSFLRTRLSTRRNDLTSNKPALKSTIKNVNTRTNARS